MNMGNHDSNRGVACAPQIGDGMTERDNYIIGRRRVPGLRTRDSAAVAVVMGDVDNVYRRAKRYVRAERMARKRRRGWA